MYCASCQQEYTEETITHFVRNHYFRPQQVIQQPNQQEQFNEVGFFNDHFTIDGQCPECRQQTVLEVEQNFKSIIIKCQNSECQQVKLYRLVIDRPPVKGTIDVTL